MPSLMLISENCPRHVYAFQAFPIVVGQASEAEIQLPSEDIHPYHAKILKEGNQFILESGLPDTSFINAEPVTRAPLNHHDIIRFGNYLFLFNTEEDGSHKTSTGKGQAGHKILLTKQELKDQRSKIISRFAKILLFIIAVGATAFITSSMILYHLPVVARESLIEYPGFQKVPFHSYFTTLLLRESASDVQSVVIKPNQSIEKIINTPRSIRLVAKLQFSKPPREPFQFRVKLLKTEKKQDKQLEIVHETLDIKTDTKSITLLSASTAPGTYTLEGTCLKASSDFQTTAKMLLYIEESSL